jgi:MerR family transcriptional regulator, thiopeptide resistance regulator
MTTKPAETYTVKQLAQLAGVTVRTLHHYDEIGLLTPPVVGANGYRYYDNQSVLRLQSIRFYRELDFSLDAIKAVFDQPKFHPVRALREQRAALEAKLGRLHRLITTIDETIRHLTGEKNLSTKQLFAGLTPEEEENNADEAAKRWGEKSVRASQKKYSAYTQGQKQQIATEGNSIYASFVAAIPQGPASAEAQAIVLRWRKHLSYFWTPNDDQCVGLAAHYRDDPAFRKNFAGLHPELAGFVADAVEIYVTELKRSPTAEKSKKSHSSRGAFAD